jgi:hypothetical protein
MGLWSDQSPSIEPKTHCSVYEYDVPVYTGAEFYQRNMICPVYLKVTKVKEVSMKQIRF